MKLTVSVIDALLENVWRVSLLPAMGERMFINSLNASIKGHIVSLINQTDLHPEYPLNKKYYLQDGVLYRGDMLGKDFALSNTIPSSDMVASVERPLTAITRSTVNTTATAQEIENLVEYQVERLTESSAINELNTKAVALAKQVEELQAQLEVQRTTYEERIAEKGKDFDQLGQSYQELANQLQKAEQSKQRLTNQQTNKNKDLEALNKEHNKLKTEHQQLKRKYVELEAQHRYCMQDFKLFAKKDRYDGIIKAEFEFMMEGERYSPEEKEIIKQKMEAMKAGSIQLDSIDDGGDIGIDELKKQQALKKNIVTGIDGDKIPETITETEYPDEVLAELKEMGLE